jgi:hypothetical protein
MAQRDPPRQRTHLSLEALRTYFPPVAASTVVVVVGSSDGGMNGVVVVSLGAVAFFFAAVGFFLGAGYDVATDKDSANEYLTLAVSSAAIAFSMEYQTYQ